PGANLSAAAWHTFEEHPLLHGCAEGVINPCHLLCRDAHGNHVIESDSDRLAGFDGKAASRSPGLTLGPADLTVEFGESRPQRPVREDLPRLLGRGFGRDGIFESLESRHHRKFTLLRNGLPHVLIHRSMSAIGILSPVKRLNREHLSMNVNAMFQ